MAEQDNQSDDKTEEATPERREEARDRGQVPLSRELTSVAVLAGVVVFLTFYIPVYMRSLKRMMTVSFESIGRQQFTADGVLQFAESNWMVVLTLILPVFGAAAVSSIVATMAQTKLSWSWEKLNPDLNRLDPISGLGRLFSFQSWIELLKGILKMLAVSLVAWLILKNQWRRVPELMGYPVLSAWAYWTSIMRELVWYVAGFLLLIGAGDFFYNWRKLEKELSMSKQDVKDDYKRREGDPLIKRRRERFARDLLNRKTLESTKEATVLLTNPTHFSVALRYEVGMAAPILVAKGVDFLALKMREVAKEKAIPIIENRALARELYATVEEGEEIPNKLYRAVAEIIRYVFELKGKALPKRERSEGETN